MTDAATGPQTPAAPPRNNNGQFSPKDGATGVVPAAEQQGAQAAGTPPPSGPQTPEEFSYEDEVEVFGEKVPVKVRSRAEMKRQLQELHAYRKRVRDIAEAERRTTERERELGERAKVDPDELARRKVLEAAKLIDMTPEQQRIYQLEQQLQKRTEADEAAKKQHEEQTLAAQRKQMRQHLVADLEKGLELTGLPKTHVTMALLAEIQEEATGQGLPPLPPDLLAAEANKRYSERGIEPLKKLQGKTLLDRLGADVVRAVLMAERERRGLAAAQQHQRIDVPSERALPTDSDKVYGEAEAEQALREMRNRR